METRHPSFAKDPTIGGMVGKCPVSSKISLLQSTEDHLLTRTHTSQRNVTKSTTPKAPGDDSSEWFAFFVTERCLNFKLVKSICLNLSLVRAWFASGKSIQTCSLRNTPVPVSATNSAQCGVFFLNSKRSTAQQWPLPRTSMKIVETGTNPFV